MLILFRYWECDLVLKGFLRGKTHRYCSIPIVSSVKIDIPLKSGKNRYMAFQDANPTLLEGKCSTLDDIVHLPPRFVTSFSRHSFSFFYSPSHFCSLLHCFHINNYLRNHRLLHTMPPALHLNHCKATSLAWVLAFPLYVSWVLRENTHLLSS